MYMSQRAPIRFPILLPAWADMGCRRSTSPVNSRLNLAIKCHSNIETLLHLVHPILRPVLNACGDFVRDCYLRNVSAEEAVRRVGACDVTVGAIGVALTLFTRGIALRDEQGVPDEERDTHTAENALIAKILSGHAEHFMALVRPHQRTVYATALSLLGNKDDAEDVVQNALLNAFSHLNQFRRESAFGTWLIQITINEVRMRWRKDRRAEMISLGHASDGDANYIPRDFQDWREIPSEALERAEVRETLLKALASIAQHYREAFVLRDIQELSITETASVLGISRGAVKTRLRRARLMLRDILAPGLGQDGRLGWSVREVTKPWG